MNTTPTQASATKKPRRGPTELRLLDFMRERGERGCTRLEAARACRSDNGGGVTDQAHAAYKLLDKLAASGEVIENAGRYAVA